MPSHILVIDQSREPNIKLQQDISANTNKFVSFLHTYPQIGLVDSKRIAVEYSNADPVCFLEDDVVLDKNFFEEIASTLDDKSWALGIGGVCRSSHCDNLLYVLFHGLFYRGIFKDSRPIITFLRNILSKKIYHSETLSGGISVWRREALNAIPFVPEDGFHMMEDMHFCRKVTNRFGPRLWINPRATLQHFPAKEGRAASGDFEKRRIEEAFAFSRYHRKDLKEILAFLWLGVGLTLISLSKSILCKSFLPIHGHLRGIISCAQSWSKE